ncbi:sigma-E factor negative regulatory protein [Diaphorobacter aerolatus]|uniref:Sigma-E factor negative regulatory protein n=1 Tax=Diaphorobacter aerolatus TaxID=1288495 RepID=A0A7H0GI62_9BURK|nr:sigma-E factor negative regulatory protein [Diaphorobacter aerolatus]QNP47978.1 sigma-E factor negative regulatory protein [Diaphorobacter aerolatus]
MNGDVVMREQLSAMVDGELVSAQCAQVVAYTESDEGRAAWHAFHLVGDVLRSSELARPPSCDLVSRLRAQLAEESSAKPLQRGETSQIAAVVQEPVARPAAQSAVPLVVDQPVHAANNEVFRWKMVAGFASLAAVATIGWNAYSSLGATQPGVQGSMQLAAAPVAVPGQNMAQANTTQLAMSLPEQGTPGQAPVMIRDPRLDELLAAHKQYGSTSALQMPAGFLRNATFEAPAR